MTTPSWRPASDDRKALLASLYGSSKAAALSAEVDRLLERHRPPRTAGVPWTERDLWLITYADQFQQPGQVPLETLHRFLDRHLGGWVNGVHVLPFYPWSSDDGFSVLDYERVDPRYGGWEHLAGIAADFRLMVDAVVNHMSAGSDWFRGFLDGDPRFAGFFRTADPAADLSATVRPRATPLLTRFQAADGPVWVWTTFSADQVDLDYRRPDVLLRVAEVLLDYARRGAQMIRLDAIAFLWKEEGTTSVHLPQTHAVIQFLRSCLDDTYPGVLLVSETNVPHEENVSYFGDGTRREAQLVYQFPLAPLVLDAFLREDATSLREWAGSLELTVPGTTFLNFLASHDGVGVRPAEGLLPADAIVALAEHSRHAGGEVGMRSLPDGSTAPYELNCTWFDLLAAGLDERGAMARHLASHAVMLALRGVPAVYVHSLFGSSNDREGYAATGRARSLNRGRFTDPAALGAALVDPQHRAHTVLTGMRRLAELRISHPAFHPDAAQAFPEGPREVLTVERTSPEGSRARVLVNVSGRTVAAPGPAAAGWSSLVDGRALVPRAALELAPWQSLWLAAPG